jgi:hypothetical protein
VRFFFGGGGLNKFMHDMVSIEFRRDQARR